jgi:hypothetical protein
MSYSHGGRYVSQRRHSLRASHTKVCELNVALTRPENRAQPAVAGRVQHEVTHQLPQQIGQALS